MNVERCGWKFLYSMIGALALMSFVPSRAFDKQIRKLNRLAG